MSADPAKILARLRALKNDRSPFEAHWQDVRAVLLPLVQSFRGQEVKGAKAHEDILDSTGETAVERLAAAMDGMLTNPATEWFALRPADVTARPDHAGAVWLDRVTDILLGIFASPRSGFGASKHELFLDEVAFGTACLYVADRPGDLPLYQARPLAECYLTEAADGRVDGVWREFRLTARQAAELWGDKAGPKVLEAATKEQDKPFDFVHAVYPRRDARAHGHPARSDTLPWASCWLSVADKHLVDERGYHEFPFMVPHWATRPGEVYGRGPGMRALGDVKMLQRMSFVTIRAGEQAIHPPLLVADDGVLDVPNLKPGGLNHYRSGVWSVDPIKPLMTGARPDIGEDLMSAVRSRIERAFYIDLLSVMQDPKMTATQIIKLDEETLRVLGPIVARMQAELLAPLIERTFGIAARAGLLPAPPPALQGRELRIEYLSPIARAQKFSEISAIGRTLELVQPLAAFDRAVVDNFDLNAMARHIADVTGVPAQLVTDPEVVARMRQARAATRDQQATAEQAIAAAPGAAKLLEAASATGLLPAGLPGAPPARAA
jgi:hypothetical protein